MKPLVSVVIRTLNEERYLSELLTSIRNQVNDQFDFEIVVIDSGSTDQTLNLAEKFQCRITHIDKQDFSFGRSLNMGCEFARGDYLVFVSGHCIPVNMEWLSKLVAPLINGTVEYTYGRQLARDTTKFSESQLFEKYFPSESKVPQEGFFCNNANSAVSRNAWANLKFDEDLTGCEDMEFAKRLIMRGGSIGYVAEAAVYHIHDETWGSVKRRYEREAIALQKIMPEVHVSIFDVISFIFVGMIKDFRAAFSKGILLNKWVEILRFRIAQYIGAYRGNHQTRQLSKEMKYRYFYPRVTPMDLVEKRTKND